jgi:hypothetical protein
VEERLERSEIVYFARAPFALPVGDDRQFLLGQKLRTGSKNISFDPTAGRAQGFQRGSRAAAERLRELLADFSRSVTGWLAEALPHYSEAWDLDRVSFRPVEEATRKQRLKARNDLLHFDAFPNRPTQGRRILRCFANINPSKPRVWITSDSFATLLKRYGRDVGLPGQHAPTWGQRLREPMLRIFRAGRPRRSDYDAFMLRFHDFLKANADFQEKCMKRYWAFPPGSAWLVFTDAVSHAALRGRFALEHSCFVSPDALLWPEKAPVALLNRACNLPAFVPSSSSSYTWQLDGAKGSEASGDDDWAGRTRSQLSRR